MGVPPTLDNIKTEPFLVKTFANYLFAHRTQLTTKTKLKPILDATIMIFHDTFRGIICNEPSGKYKYPTHHLFHDKIISVPEETQISVVTLT